MLFLEEKKRRRRVSDANDNLLTDRTPVCVSRFKFRPAPFKREINKYISNQRYRTLFLLGQGHMSLRGKKRNSLERSSSSDHPIRSVSRGKNSEICFFFCGPPSNDQEGKTKNYIAWSCGTAVCGTSASSLSVTLEPNKPFVMIVINWMGHWKWNLFPLASQKMQSPKTQLSPCSRIN